MHLESLYLKDFGPHERLEINLNSPIAGVVGRNGSGKSNVLQALRFALTGILPANKEAVIRNFGAEGGAKSAHVELCFTADGKKGVITREINAKTSYVCLEHGAYKCETRGEVARQMEILLGADKDALASAVFINQGEIDKLVRGTPAERQNLFFRILNLSYLAKRADKAGEMAKKLRKGIQDLTPLVDEVRTDIIALTADEDELKRRLAGLDDVSKELAEARGKLSIRIASDTAASYCSRLQGTLRGIEEQASPLIERYYPDGPAELPLVVRLSMAHGNAKDMRKKSADSVKQLEDLRAGLQKKQMVGQQLDLAASQLEIQRKRLTDLRVQNSIPEDVDYATLKATHDVWVANESSKVKLEELNASASRLREAVKQDEQAYANADKELKELMEQREELEKQASDAEAKAKKELEQLTAMRWKLETVLSWVPGEGEATCPLCGGPAHIPTQEERETYTAQLEEAKRIEKGIRTKVAEISDLLMRVRERSSGASQLAGFYIQSANKKKQELKAVEEEAAALKETISAQTANLPELPGCTLRELMYYIGSSPSILESIKLFEREVETRQKEAEECEQYTGDLTKVKEDLAFTKAQYNSISTDDTTLGNLVEQVYDTNKAYAIAKEEARQADLLGIPLEEELNLLIDALYTKDSEYRQMVALLGEKTAAKEAKEQRLGDLVKKTQEDSERLKKAKLLEQAKDVLSRPNLPMAYASKTFEAITGDVNELLLQMGANFSVTPDPVEPITFRFTRTDGYSDTPMCQERLSGGQAIRLALALLISMQKLILSNVGLLVLDEPSSHIDTEGIDSMAALFRSLSGTFAKTQMQLVVVDHSPVIASSFGKTTSL